MGPIFDANEKIKEEMVLNFFAYKAKTTFHQNGSFYLNDPFLETEIFWESSEALKKINIDQTEKLHHLLKQLQKDVLEYGGQMTPPIFEYRDGAPLLVWAQFFTDGIEENP